VSGLGVAVGLILARTHVAAPVGSWLAVATPLLGAATAALAAAALLRWRKVGDRASIMTALLVTALAAFSAAQFARLADASALGSVPASEWAAWTTWQRGFAWLGGVALFDVPVAAPGLEPIADLLGRDGTWGFLAGELIFAVGLVWSVAVRTTAAPLCPSCRAWCVRERGFATRDVHEDAALVRERAELRDWRFFRDLGPPRGPASLRFDVARCPSCERGHALSIIRVRPVVPDQCLVEDLRLGADDMRTLRDLVELDQRARGAGLPLAAQPKERAVAGAGRA
jgi:hypothetical protein